MALRRAEQSAEGDHSPSTAYPVYRDSSAFPSDPVNAFNASESRVARSPSPNSNAAKSDNEDSSTDDEGNDDDHADDSSSKARNQNDRDRARLKRDSSSANEIISEVLHQPRLSYNDSSDFGIHRESNLLLQMVPYRPVNSNSILSDRLIAGGHGPDSGTTSATQEVTKSVRILLDKWTTSGSAPISDILDVEAERETFEASVEKPSLVLELANSIL